MGGGRGGGQGRSYTTDILVDVTGGILFPDASLRAFPVIPYFDDDASEE